MRSKQLSVLAALFSMVGFLNAAVAEEPAKAPSLPKGKQVVGTMQIGDKTYKLEHVVAYSSKVFDEQRPSLLFSDKPIDVKKLQAAIQKDGSDDSFSTFQTHVKVTFDEAGKPSFCNAYADNNSLSVSGGRLEGELKIENGVAQGKTSLAQDPESKRKGNFSAQFNTPLLKVAEPTPKTNTAKTAANPATPGKLKAEQEPKSAKALKAVSVFDLPMPKDAKDIERKELVGHIKYTSANSVKSVVSLLQKKLAEQGWQTEDEDFNAPASSILHRKRGEASLTIFVKPATGGCTVTIMSEGLNWDEPPAE